MVNALVLAIMVNRIPVRCDTRWSRNGVFAGGVSTCAVAVLNFTMWRKSNLLVMAHG